MKVKTFWKWEISCRWQFGIHSLIRSFNNWFQLLESQFQWRWMPCTCKWDL